MAFLMSEFATNTFRSLRIRSWRQFEDVSIAFHPRLSILTGANGAGKTTLLHLLNRHWGWNIPYVSAPSQTALPREKVVVRTIGQVFGV